MINTNIFKPTKSYFLMLIVMGVVSVGMFSSCKKNSTYITNNNNTVVPDEELNWANQKTTFIDNVAYKYIPISAGIVLTGVITSNTTLTLPSAIDGKPVISMVGIYIYNDLGFIANTNKNIQHLTIPNSFTSIGNFCFVGWKALQSIVLPDSITSIGNEAFIGCDNLTTINLPNSIQYIGESALSECPLTSITLPTNLKTISKYLVAHCTNLSTIVIPNQVTTIGERAFFDVGNDFSIIIPSSVKVIEDRAFQSDKKINVRIEATTPPIIGYGVFDTYRSNPNTPNTDATIEVPIASVNTYKTALGWSKYANQIVGY